jgi:peptide deformylase
MIHPIVKLGDPVLETPAAVVTSFDDGLKKLVEDMFESMYAARGVGLAAPQIGISKRIAVVDVTFKTVTVRAQDLSGKFFEHTGEELLARALLHETDHLNGKLYISHISALKRDLIKRKIKKLAKAGEW